MLLHRPHAVRDFIGIEHHNQLALHVPLIVHQPVEELLPGRPQVLVGQAPQGFRIVDQVVPVDDYQIGFRLPGSLCRPHVFFSDFFIAGQSLCRRNIVLLRPPFHRTLAHDFFALAVGAFENRPKLFVGSHGLAQPFPAHIPHAFLRGAAAKGGRQVHVRFHLVPGNDIAGAVGHEHRIRRVFQIPLRLIGTAGQYLLRIVAHVVPFQRTENSSLTAGIGCQCHRIIH